MRTKTTSQMVASTSGGTDITDVVQSLKRKATDSIKEFKDLELKVTSIEDDYNQLRQTMQHRLNNIKKLGMENQGLRVTIQDLNNTIQGLNDELKLEKKAADDRITHLSNDNENLRTRLNIQAQERSKITLQLLDLEDADRQDSVKCTVCMVGELALSFKTGKSLIRLCCSLANCCDKIYMCTDCYDNASARNAKCVICRNNNSHMITYEHRLALMTTPAYQVIPDSPAYHPDSPAYHPAYSPTTQVIPDTPGL